MTKLPQKLPEKYDAKAIEKKWQNYWRQEENFKKIFAWKNDLPKEQTFVIDTPPPTVSGLLHMGHVFSYTQADFVARFQRMLGKDVFYPMGFDDNGLPTERLVEKVIGKKAGVFEAENGRGSFVAKCREVVFEAEKEFEAMFNSIALSVDWEQKYQTISPESQKISQASFVDLYRKGLVERKFEPVFWDISDRTALAQADLVDKEMPGMMNEIKFGVEGSDEKIVIMTTRPELLPACVAVMIHPDDARYKHLHGKFAITPLFGVKVPIIADDLVQMEKGTGAVMCCTFGDETDVKWWRKYDLKLKVILGEDGRFDRTSLAAAVINPYKDNIPQTHIHPNHLGWVYNLISDLNGKTIKQAKEAIIEALKNTRSNHPPLEGGSQSVSDAGRGQKAQRFYSTEILSRAQELRKNTTDAEGLLWYYLQNKQLDGHKFRRQQPIGDYIVDFVCLEKKLVVELDGGQHGEDSAIKYDQKRTDFLQQSGFKVLRFWNAEVFENMSDVLDSIFFNLDSDPSPKAELSTLPQGEGDNSEFQSILLKQTPITHSVKCAERSGVPIEILVAPQWFVKILDKKAELKAQANKCNWFPDYMRIRIEQWIDGLSWDWCISRQRFFGVPFPIWYSKRAGEEGKVLVAEIDQLPCDPVKDLPRGYSREEVTAETDIMDTWATSSISPQLSSHGISDEISFDKARHQKLFPADLRPQAHEIIRTWAFYTITKSLLHQNSVPWKNLMISGWCLAADKTKMSKSKGNVVTPTSLIEEKGSDIVRYWASTSHLGADTAYSEEVFKIGQKLTTKLFNAAKFVVHATSLSDFGRKPFGEFSYPVKDLEQPSGYRWEVATISSVTPHHELRSDILETGKIGSKPSFIDSGIEVNLDSGKKITEAADLWILSKLQQTIKRATESFEIFEYARAREAIEEFFWKDFCDNYLEICKVRAYGLAAEKLAGIEFSDEEKAKILAKQQSAILTLHHCLNRLLKLFAPFIPHICDEIFSVIFAEEFENFGSVNARGTWPKLSEEIFDQKFCDLGEAALKVIFEVRKFKSEKNLSMKVPVKKVRATSMLKAFAADLANVCNAEEIELNDGGDSVEVIL